VLISYHAVIIAVVVFITKLFIIYTFVFVVNNRKLCDWRESKGNWRM